MLPVPQPRARAWISCNSCSTLPWPLDGVPLGPLGPLGRGP